MHLQIILVELILCSTFFCLSNGAPVEGSGTEAQANENLRRYFGKDPFTPEEDDFILKEVYEQAPNKRAIWTEIAEKHKRNLNNKVPGFIKERSAENLRRQFHCHLKLSDPNWRSKFHINCNGYSDQEDEFINKELLSDSYRDFRLSDDALWQDIIRKHNLKRLANCKGFSTERTVGGIRAHFMNRMRREGRVSREVKARFPQYCEMYPGPTIFSGSDGVLEGGSETSELSQRGASKPGYYFSPEEDAFIIKQALSHAQTTQKIPWKQIIKEHERKVRNKEVGFVKKRSADNLRKHFGVLKRTIPQWKPRTTTYPQRYSEQEEKLINEELVNNAFRSNVLYDGAIWQAILEKHKLKRQQKCDGFPKDRTRHALRCHFMSSMKPGQRVSEEVKARFSKYFGTTGEGTITNEGIHPDPDSDPFEDAVSVEDDDCEDNDVFGNIMRDLGSSQKTVDEDGIDHCLFVEKGFPSSDWQSGLLQLSSDEDKPME